MNSNLKNSEIVFAKHTGDSLLIELRKIVNNFFPEDHSYYSNLTIHDYRSIVNKAQEALNQKDFSRRIALNLKNEIVNYIGEESFLIQSNLYLRATRFGVRKDLESINWHRETFYGPNMEKSLNIWTPIINVTKLNTLRFIPESQKIPDKDISIESIDDPVTRKGSDGNRIGFLYAPKKIIGGVNLDNSAPMIVPYNFSSIFPGNLIHGAGVNYSNKKIRFSVDFRVLPKSSYDPNLSKKVHISSGKPYFEDL
jgi:ectoine hydroxylase-related dioxygenase (phytanoyl-CoA dioxygenase family)